MPTDEEIKVALAEVRAHHVPQVYARTLAQACDELRRHQARARSVLELEQTFAAIRAERDMAERRLRVVAALCERCIREIAGEGYESWATQLRAELESAATGQPQDTPDKEDS